MIRRTHYKVACAREHPEGFNAVAKGAALWTYETLTAANRMWLAALPQGPLLVDEVVEICHGSPFDEDAYIFDELDAVRALKVSTRPLCLFGHTHYPVTFELSADTFDSPGPAVAAEMRLMLRPGSKYLVNPGAVGQPRDGDPRAADAIAHPKARCVHLVRLCTPASH